MKVFLWLTLFKKSVPIISIWGISVIPVRCCHGTPLENAALGDLYYICGGFVLRGSSWSYPDKLRTAEQVTLDTFLPHPPR